MATDHVAVLMGRTSVFVSIFVPSGIRENTVIEAPIAAQVPWGWAAHITRFRNEPTAPALGDYLEGIHLANL